MKNSEKKDTHLRRRVSRAKKRKIRYPFISNIFKRPRNRVKTVSLSYLLACITILAFVVNSPVVQLHPNELKDFTLSSKATVFRTGKPVSFKWALMGAPQKLIIVFGDGSFQELSSECFHNNGMIYGSIDHMYGLQGKYTPILKAYYPGETLKKILDVFIRNDAPFFSFGFNGEVCSTKGGLHISSSPFQTFEDDEVDITVNVTNNLTNDTLTYQFNFGDSQVVTENNSITHAWENKGSYPVTITVVGAQGELSKQTQYIDVLNRRPNASIRITNEQNIAVGKEIEFTAEDSYDTPSDMNSLRYIWNWGDGLMDYGKIVSHTYYESGSFNVSLIVKDDDSFVDQTSQTIVIENINPDITIDNNFRNSSLIINEGEEMLFSASSQDDDPDIFKLLYYWNFGSVKFDPLSLENYQLGGWKSKHVFVDDFEGNVTVGVIDSSNEFNSDLIAVKVVNVAPEIGLFSASFVSNISFQVYRNDKAMEANFTFVVFKDNESAVSKLLSFSNSNQTEISTDRALALFSLANQWKIVVNSSEILPTDSVFQASIKLTFADGQELVLNSEQMQGGSYGEWEADLSSEFYDAQSYSYKYPITFTTKVVDPSKDEVQYSVSYQESKLLEINCSGILPITDSFTVEGTEFFVKVYEQDSKQYANITAQKLVFSKLFDNHTFPLREDVQINVSPLINIYDILQGRLGLSDLTVESCLIANNKITISAVDDDLGEDTLTFCFESLVGIELTQGFVPINSSTSSNAIPVPSGKIGGFSSTAYEGERVKFTSKTNDQDVPGMIFMWDFGDGTFTYSEHSKHAWVDAGVYNITLTIADPFGNIHRDQENITILSKAPEIVGPFAFQGSEGSSIVLDVKIYDSSKDEPRLEYFWYDDKGLIISQEQKPVLTLDDGTYVYTLKVVDPSGMSSSKEIVVTMHSLSPEIYMSNYMYHGVLGDYRVDNNGELELTAYATDTLLDSEKLCFYWTIRNGKKVISLQDGRYQHYSTVTFTCKETTTYQGEVRVVDPEGNEKVVTFQIVSTIDSTLDGVDDKTEEMLRLSDDPLDTDGDGLTDTYEMTVSNTSYLDPDTDGDLLWDGQTVNGSVGEQAVSTDPLDWDCDDDFLSDGTEYFGWNITVVYFENTMNFHVTSDPLDSDTDNDGLNDYAEYYAGSNPRQADTDNDDLTDDIDPFPTKWDGDEDLLSDYEEIMRGTDYNNSDTDQDGLTDGAEVYGWGIGFFTDPLDADSDHDHVSDSAEIRNYLVKLQDEGFDDLDKKLPITQPVSLHFPHHFDQAVAAQISFGIAFGEYGENATSSYGVEDTAIDDLSIIITKKDDGMLLANFTTNSTRYFSQTIDITPIMNNISLELDYFGDYEIALGYPTESGASMGGNYPGTYSFEDEVGKTGTDIEFVDGNNYPTCEIVSEMDGHNEVLKLTSNTGWNPIWDDISDQNSGTVEWWVRTPIAYYSHRLIMYDGATQALYIYFHSDGKIYARVGSATYVTTYSTNTWTHVRIDFECGEGGYEGLSSDTFWVYIDGEKFGPFNFKTGVSAIDKLYWDVGGGINTRYMDAVGYSWDPDYEVGDNEDVMSNNYEYSSNEGSFDGTYSFEDEVDETGTDIEFVDFNNYPTCEIVSEMDGHNEVLKLTCDTGWNNIWDGISDQSSGTVEWWVRTPIAYYSHRLIMYDGTTQAINLYFQSDGKIYARVASATYVTTYSTNTWTHVRVDFECVEGGYEGLSHDTFWVYIDGEKFGPFNFKTGVSAIDKLYWDVGGGSNTRYMDAVGYSWDPDYNVGDNFLDYLNPKCYLEYFNLEFSGYSQDFDPNDADSDDDGILDGVEMGVLVRGNDNLDFEEYYYGNNLTLNTIKNYNATYSFENEFSGTSGTDIDFVDYAREDDVDCNARITSEVNGHSNVLELYDYSDSKYMSVRNYFGDNHLNPTIEFWASVSTIVGYRNMYFYLWEYGATSFYPVILYFSGSRLKYRASSSDITIKTITANTWYHIKLVLDDTANTFDCYVDNVLEVNDIPYRLNTTNGINRMMINTRLTNTNYSVYLDAMDYSWDPYYEEGRSHSDPTLEVFDSGLYYGTYSFEDEVNEMGTDIEFIDFNNYPTCEIVSEMDGHNEVLKLTCDTGWNNIWDGISDQSSGTVEWWVRTPIAYYSHRLIMYDGTTQAINLYFQSDGKIYARVASATYVTMYSANTWTHVRVDFECVEGGYEGLSHDTFWVYIDGEKFGPFNFKTGVSAIDKLYWDVGGVSNTRYMDAVGYSWDPDYEVGDNRIPTMTALSDVDEFYLEIPQIGVVYDSQLYLKVESDEIPEGFGKVFVQLVKEQASLLKTDIVLLDYWGTFDATQAFSYEKSIDLSPYISTKEVYGTYQLRIKAFGSIPTDIFNLTRFEIESDTYVTAEFGDNEAWVTNPAESDTDGDNLSDYYEIFTGGTNPTSVDTDGDDAWDDDDRDPLRDVMLEIQPLYGQFDIYNNPWHNPIMQIVINSSFVCEDYAIITPCEIATEVTGIYDNYYHRAYFTDFQYYINIDDHEEAYEDVVMIPLQLWEVKRHLGQNDVLLAGEYVGGIWYDFAGPSTQELFTVYNNHWVYVEFTLVGIEKANTFAIYDINSTFTGRYHDSEQGFSVIQLQIPDDGHYLGTESFLEDQLGANSTSIAFVDEDDSDVESAASIVREIDGHTQVLRLEEGTSDHADITHDFVGQEAGTIEWWWRTSDNDGTVNFDIQYNGYAAIRLSMKNGKIYYNDGSDHEVKDITINTWYRITIDFICKYGGYPIYEFNIFVDGVLKKAGAGFCLYYPNAVNSLRIYTEGDPFYSYFDAFGFSWDNNYDLGDNDQTYSVEGTPFEHGMNVIVVPTELFTHTLLNGYLENDNLDQTPIYHPDKNMFEFCAIARNGQPTQANADADFMLYRRSISPSDAMEVLELVLKGLLNETWEEEDAIYLHSYICTKENGTKATQMNLPYSVLGYIPWFNPYSNSKMGDEPMPSGGFDLFLWLLCLFNPLLAENLHNQMAMTGGEYYKYLKGFTANILMNILTVLGDLLWLVARAALYVLAWVFVAIHIAFQTILYVTIGVTMLLLTALTEGYCEFNWNFVEFSTGSRVFRMESDLTWYYWEFYDLEFPWIVDRVYDDGTLVMSTELDVLLGTEISEYDVDEDFKEDDEKPPTLHCDFTQVDDTTFKFWTMYDDSCGGDDAPDQTYGVKLHLVAPNGNVLSPISMSVHSAYLPDPDYSRPVNYTATVDLSTLYSDDGLWHYYFSTNDNSGEHDIVFIPDNRYYLGPLTTSINPYILQYSTIISEYDDSDTSYSPVGFLEENFEFLVEYYGGEEPERISLCIIPANITDGVGVPTNTRGIKKFTMSPIEENPDYSGVVEFNKTINFESLGYSANEIGSFWHYFEVELQDGTLAYTFGANLDENSNPIKEDIYGPLVVDEAPQLYDYDLYDLVFNWGIMGVNPWDKPRPDFYAATTYNSFRFKVYYEDPDGLGLAEGYPRLIFKNQKTEEELDPIIMSDYWNDLIYGEFFYSCIVDCSFLGPGLWEWRIEGKNSNDVDCDTLYGKEVIWVSGDPLVMIDSFMINSLLGGSLPMGIFLSAATVFEAKMDSKWGYVLAGTGLATGIASQITNLVLACSSNDPYYLLGSAIAYITNSFFCFGINADEGGSIPQSNFARSLRNFALPSHFLAFFGILRFLNSLTDPMGGFFSQVPIFDSILDIMYLPTSIGLNLGLAMGISSLLSDFTVGLSGIASPDIVLAKIIKGYGLFSLILGVFSLSLWITKAQVPAPDNLGIIQKIN